MKGKSGAKFILVNYARRVLSRVICLALTLKFDEAADLLAFVVRQVCGIDSYAQDSVHAMCVVKLI